MGLFAKIKKKSIVTIFLCTVLILPGGCGDPQKEITVYGRFKDNYTTDKFDVSCDWESVNILLDAGSFKEYSLYPTPVYSFDETEKYRNAIGLIGDRGINEVAAESLEVSYGAQICSSVQSTHGVGERFFTEPMIQIYIYNAQADKEEAEPDYLPGYRAVYSLDGELALEEGKWFLDENKDEFCQNYFEIMRKVIGKDK